MSGAKVSRCAACAKRIRPHAPRIGLIDLESRREISYHARPGCRLRGMREMAVLMECGKAYVLRHFHGAACPDEAPGFGCSGGCFDAPVAMAN